MSGSGTGRGAAFLLLLLGIFIWSVPVHAVGDGNDLLPDMSVGSDSVMLESLLDIGSNLVTDITNAGDGSGRLFIVSPDGVVRIHQNGALLATPFLNVPASPANSAMTGLAFHPDYATNGISESTSNRPSKEGANER